MGGICSRSWKATVDGVAVDNVPGESSRHSANGHAANNNEAGTTTYQSISSNINSNSHLPPLADELDKHQRESFSFTGLEKVPYGPGAEDINDGIPRLPRSLSHKSRKTVKLSYRSHV
jgi:hypothetical protein